MSSPRTLCTRRRVVATTGAVAVVGSFLVLPSAYAASVSSAVFSGSAGTLSVGGVLYAKQGAALTLTVVTSSDTKCVDVTGAAALPRQTSSTAKSSWTFTTTAPAGDGAQAFTVAASPNYNVNGACTGQTNSTQASYTLDNTGPTVSSALTPAPNAAGWNKANVSIAWSATDSGVGMTGGQAAQPSPATDSVTANTSVDGVTKTATGAKDALGNAQNAGGSVVVKLDKTAPTITAAQTANADGTTTITFTCSDAPSGIAACVADGSTTNSKTVGPGVTVTGRASDRAGNTASASSTAPAGDSTAPTLSGAPTTQPNGTNGWYTGDVTVRWNAADPESGIPAAPADTTITGEGTGLTSTQSVTNGAGLSATAISSPAVRIDRNAPNTGISHDSGDWADGDVDVVLSPTDNLSTVASTSYQIGDGPVQSGTRFSLATEGTHTVRFSSTDGAGNAEAPKTATIKIDKAAPQISHSFSAPANYADGAWTNQDVRVVFTCTDSGSGVAACTEPVTTSGEGAGQQVVGTATDNAGRSATDTALVSIDKTPPVVTPSVSGVKNDAGWYKEDVEVGFSAEDQSGLSGVAGSVTGGTTLQQGTNQSASGSASDAAGNTGSATVSGINIDTTAPELSGSFVAGWHTGDVTVEWTCTDAGGSGVKGPQPADTVVEGEGAGLTATASCEDVAGNTVTKTETGIQIDRTKPTTTGAVTSGSLTNDWYRNPVQVTLGASDNLSGVAATYYAVDGGAAQTYTAPFSVSAEGQHSISFWSVDGAGHVEVAGTPLTFQIDRTAPDTAVINPISPDSGWFVSAGIPVAFQATDNTGGSGIAATYYSIDGGAPQTYGVPFTAELAEGTHTITYWSVDLAGNVEMKDSETFKTVTVNVDTQAPTVTPGDVDDTTWRNTDLSQAFTASDTGSGLASSGDASFSLTASAESTKDGTNVVPTSVETTVADKAGNATTRRVSALIDRTSPTDIAFVGGPVEGTRYYTSTLPTAPTCSATDALSGVKECKVTGYSTTQGTHALTATATDNAGNTATATRTYVVKNLERKGFYAPVDGSGVYNTIKGGNTVPLKFEVFDGTTELKTTAAIGAAFTAAKVSCTTGGEDAIEVFTTTGQTELRYDTTADQFVQNWKTPTGSGCYKATVTTVDGQVLSALFKTLK